MSIYLLSILTIIVGACGAVASIPLSVGYFKRNDPERYAAGLMPVPGSGIVPGWVSAINIGSWLIIVLGIMMALLHYFGINWVLAITSMGGYIILKISKLSKIRYYLHAPFSSQDSDFESHKPFAIPLWIKVLSLSGWCLLLLPWLYLFFERNG